MKINHINMELAAEAVGSSGISLLPDDSPAALIQKIKSIPIGKLFSTRKNFLRLPILKILKRILWGGAL